MDVLPGGYFLLGGVDLEKMQQRKAAVEAKHVVSKEGWKFFQRFKKEGICLDYLVSIISRPQVPSFMF